MKFKTKRYTRDLDQILYTDMNSEKSIQKLEHQSYDETKPGLGQYYCIPCAKYFETLHAKSNHQRGKVHKRRLRQLKDIPYTPEEANAAAGHDVAKFFQKKEERKNMTEAPAAQEQMVKKNKLSLKEELEVANPVAPAESIADDAMQVEES